MTSSRRIADEEVVHPRSSWGQDLGRSVPLTLDSKREILQLSVSVCTLLAQGISKRTKAVSMKMARLLFLIHDVLLLTQLAGCSRLGLGSADGLPNCCSQSLDESCGQLVGMKPDVTYERLDLWG